VPHTGRCRESCYEGLAWLLSTLGVLDAPLVRAAASSRCCDPSCKPGSCPGGGPSALHGRAVQAGESLDFKGSYKEDRGSPRSHVENSRGNGLKLHQERFHLDIRKQIFCRENNH